MKINVVQLELKKTYEIDIPAIPEHIFVADQVAPVFCATIGNLNVEHSAAVCLDNANRVINYYVMSIGEIDTVKVPLAQLFRVALLSNASKIVVAHNHPSGVLEVTSKDVELTRKIAFFANAFSMELIDSLVVSSGDFVSIRRKCKEFSYDRENSAED